MKRTSNSAAQNAGLTRRPITVPEPSRRRFYGYGLPNVDLHRLAGRLIVVEGADGSGRSTQIARLRGWLEGCGHATVSVGLKRSTLVSEELDQAQQGNILSRTTLSLFYATDFADQMENIILPGLKAGFMVLADRYIYTLMARDLVRGMDLGLSREMFDSFLKYQALMARQFTRLQAIYGFSIVDGDRSPDEVNMELQLKIEAVLKGR